MTAADQQCKTEGCEKPVIGRGYCSTCYARKNRNGEIKGKKARFFWPSVRDKFEAMAMPITDIGCWLWLGSFFSNGYGQCRDPISKKNRKTNRLAWELYKGPIPEGMLVCHKCDNRWCVNPDHLFLGTSQDNVDDMHQKGRHSFGGSHGMVKLTSKQVLEIRSSSDSLNEAAQKYGVTFSNISRIRRGITWRHLL